MVVMVGVDVHKDTHCAVAVDQTGRQIGKAMTFRTTDTGCLALWRWAARQGAEHGASSDEHGGVQVVVAVEDCRHLTTRLERALLAAGARVLRVPPKLMAGSRHSARTRGKSDPIDALAIARAALREPDLPVAEHTHQSRTLKLLVDHREDLVAMRTAAQNRLRWHLHTLNQVTAAGSDPVLDPPARSLDVLKQLDQLAARVEAIDPDELAVDLQVTRRVALELIVDIRGWTVRERALEREIAALMAELAPRLLNLPGCGALTAAKLVGESAGAARFRSEAAFAMHAGVAPIPASSGKTTRHRLARGGNRQLNAALHRIAVTQVRLTGSLGHAYYQRRQERGDTTMEALRALKRRLARVVYGLLTAPDTTAAAPLPQAA
jgi:transposase